MISINTDINALVLQNTLGYNTKGLNSAIQKMTTGYKINQAKDDAAGFYTATILNSKISSMIQAQSNVDMGIALLSTAEGSLNNIMDILQRLRDLSEQASNEVYGSDSRLAMQAEADQLIDQIDKIKKTTEFNGLNLFEGPPKGVGSTNSVITNSIGIKGRAVINSAPTARSTSPLAGEVAVVRESSSVTNAGEGYTTTTANTSSTNPTPQSSSTTRAVDIEGAEDFSGSATKTITIDGVEYTVKNRLTTQQTLSYTKDKTTGEVTFLGSDFEIRGQSDVSHNIVINGNRNNVYGGSLNDNIVDTRGNSWNNLYGEVGDDTITANSTFSDLYGGAGDDILASYDTYATFYGQDGRDTLNSNAISCSMDGGADDDVFNISGNTLAGASIKGGDGDDTFNLIGNRFNLVIDGGTGTNTVTGTIGNNTLANVVGANAFIESFKSNETKTIEVSGIKYTVTSPSAGDLICKITDSGSIRFTAIGVAMTIRGQSDVSHNVELDSGNLIFYGGDKDDKIIGHIDNLTIYAGGGNDTITAYNSTVYAGSGNNTITANSHSIIYGGTGSDNIILNGSYCQVIGSTGSMNVTANGQQNLLVGGTGTNTVTNSGTYNFISGFGSSDNAQSVRLNAYETKTVTINGIDYTIKNTRNQEQAVGYTLNPVSGEINFIGGISIQGQSDASHNVKVYGAVSFQGGDKGDKITAYGWGQYIYGNNGDDTITFNINSNNCNGFGDDGDDEIILNGTVNAYGNAGSDTITINVNLSSNRIDAGGGDDVYNINAIVNNLTDSGGNNIYNIKTDNANISGGSGADTFYVNGNNNTVLGAGSDDYYLIYGNNNALDGGTGNNYYVDSGIGNTYTNVNRDPNSGKLVFTTLNETKTFTLNGKTYTVTNDFNGSNTLEYSLNPNTGVITLNGSNLTTNAQDSETAILNIRGDNNTVNGSNLNDRIIIESGSSNIINGGKGDDILTSDSINNELHGGEGNDILNINASTNKLVSGGDGNDTVNINSSNNTNINTGNGNDRVTGTGNTNTINVSSGDNNVLLTGNTNTITGGDGNNRLSAVGDTNTITSGNGNNTIGVDGDNNSISNGNGTSDINIYGDNNISISQNGQNDLVINGHNNTYTSTGGNKDVNITGNGNRVTTGNGNDSFTIIGETNNITTTGGENDSTITGNNNEYQGGSGVDRIEISGDENRANGGGANDTFVVRGGNENVIDGEAGDRNILRDNGIDTRYSNVVLQTLNSFELTLKVDTDSSENSYIHTTIGFDTLGFSVDFSTSENARRSLDDIDALMSDVQKSLLHIGATVNRLTSIQDAQTVKLHNLISSLSTVKDADIAKESSAYIRYQILQQATVSLMQTTRNLRAESVLGLINGAVIR